jgi:sigma-E factor negative regulatory protein RseB
VSGRHSAWRVASAIIALILLGACAAALTLRHSPAGGRTAADQPDSADPPSGGSAGAAALTASGQLAERLMTQATTAAGDTAYSGVQVSNWWGPSGLSSSSLDVWHRPGGGMVAQAVADPSDAPGIQLPWFGSGDPVSAMTMSGKQLRLLLENYQLKYAGRGSASGRSAQVISVVGADGKLVARFWLDCRTKLPLRREVFDSGTHLISDIRLVDLKLGAGALAGMPAAEAQPWTRQLDGDAIRALRRSGWPVPQRLAGLMRLFAASEADNADGLVVDASYSDGLLVISLFVQRGQLPGTLPGWQRVAIDGHHAYTSETDERTIAWSSGGFVFTMIADAPPGTVDQAVVALAGSGSTDFWTRIGRGFRRLASLANLFR